jgi:enamine deaminase RidA (YjgF/YER057c/UK114 family)
MAAPGADRRAGAGNPGAQLRESLELLDRSLWRCGSALSQTVRLDLFLRDIDFADAAREVLAEIFGEGFPATTFVGADLEEGIDVKLNAIAA